MRTIACLMALSPAFALGQSAGQWHDSAQVWRSLCRYCHETTIAPPLLGLPLPSALTIATVRAGHNAMPAFTSTQVDDQELAKLAQWITQQPAARAGAHP